MAVLVTSASLVAQPWFGFSTGIETVQLLVPDGEAAKTPEVLSGLVEAIAEHGLSRHDVIVAVGGGAITDLAGFAAAVYLRGVAFVQVPTSLVGQVDAAIGGKTAVNLKAGKNLMGAFHQPIGVLCDTELLATLPAREQGSGLGEVVKCWLLEGRQAADLNTTTLMDLVVMSVALKARIVSADEFESGERAFLNYGHTLAHAIEKLALARDVDEVRHGEAVAIGLAFAVRLAKKLGRVDDAAVQNVDDALRALALPSVLPGDYETNALLDAMTHDKKAHHDLTFVLPGQNGFAVVNNIDATIVREALEEFRSKS
jgi:5-deoxy-5-amino-3-dehydroquinate synthase